MNLLRFIKIQLADGTLNEIKIEFSEQEPWQLILYNVDDSIKKYTGSDLFEALQIMRKDFELLQIQLLCAGARTDVAPSGMSRNMGGGRQAYILETGRPGSPHNMIDIFDYADPRLVGTVQKQKDYFTMWANSLKRQ